MSARKKISQREAARLVSRVRELEAERNRLGAELDRAVREADTHARRGAEIRALHEQAREKQKRVQYSLGSGMPVLKDSDASEELKAVLRTAWALGRVVIVRVVEPYTFSRPDDAQPVHVEYFAAEQV